MKLVRNANEVQNKNKIKNGGHKHDVLIFCNTVVDNKINYTNNIYTRALLARKQVANYYV